MKGGRQRWVLTHCHLVFVHGQLSLYMGGCSHPWGFILACGRSSSYVNIRL